MQTNIKNHLIEILDSALTPDYAAVRKLANEVAKLLDKQDPEFSKKIRSILRTRGMPLMTSAKVEQLPVDIKSRLPLIEEAEWPTTPLFIDDETHLVFSSFLKDIENAEKLHDAGISAKLCLLLAGPPGTGKSLLAGHVAAQLGRPLYVVRLDSLISSFLGDTAKNIRGIFEHASRNNGVLFLDEIDAIAKLRDDRHELGELKRVVNTVIQALDSVDYNTVIIAATNHPHLLDSAIWRRFPYKISLESPSLSVREQLWNKFLFADEDGSNRSALLAKISEGMTGAEIETLALAAMRRKVLDGSEINFADVASSILNSKEDSLYGSSLAKTDRHDMNLLIARLVESKLLTQTEAAELFGTSRQNIHAKLVASRAKGS